MKGDTRKLRIILGFESDEACELYKQYDLRNVTKAQVLRHLEAYIDDHT